MASQPVDYISGLGRLPDPLRDMQEQMAAQIGLRRGQLANETAELQNQAGRSEMEQRQAFQRDMEQALVDPTPANFSNVIARHPKYAEEVKRAWDVRDRAERQRDLTQMGEVYSAGKNGRFDLAAAALRRRIDADKAAGDEDPQDAAILAALESNDPVQQRAALGMLGTHLAILTGPEHMSGVLEQLGDKRKLTTVVPGATVIDETGTEIYSSPYKPQLVQVTNPDGSTSQIEYVPGNGPQGGGGATGGTPRGIRNNNPGNIEDGPFAKAQPGYKGSDGRFAVFETPEQGAAAGRNLVQSYIRRGVNTPAAIAQRWAPAGENGAASTNNYAAYIAKRLGIGPNDPVTVGQAAQIQQAMAEFENGQQQGGGGTREVARSAAKPVVPSQTRVVNGTVYVKVNGQWLKKRS